MRWPRSAREFSPPAAPELRRGTVREPLACDAGADGGTWKDTHLCRVVALSAMSTTAPTGDLYLVVGYDGSPPASRALDAATSLLRGRTGRIEVVYVAHMPSIDMLSPGAVAEMEVSFDDIARDLHAAAGDQLHDR